MTAPLLPLTPPVALGAFAGAGVLGVPDVHVAQTLARLGRDDRAEVLLAAALAVRAPRRQHVCVDLRTVRDTIVSETVDDRAAGGTGEGADVDALPWPDPDAWIAVLRNSALVAVRDPHELSLPDGAGADVAPLTLAGDRLYLDRYWRHERSVARALHDRAARMVDGVDRDRLRDLLAAGFDGDAPDRQRVAAALAVTRHLAVVAGGPGTGKTTTVATILRLLDDLADHAGTRRPAVALAAPTGKAAARLTASLREAAARAGGGTTDGVDAVDARLREATATTLHRLLGADGRGGFRRGPGDPLPHDVVVVDETSMVALPLLARLLGAVRDEARVVLLGDPHQLASVEAGSVLADVVGDPAAAPRRSATSRTALAQVTGDAHLADTVEAERAGVHDAIVVLDRVHRFAADSGLDRFARAVRAGDADAALHELAVADDLHWLPPPADRSATATDLAPVHDLVVAAGTRLRDTAADGDGAGALEALDDLRVLCAHRRGDHGVEGWIRRAHAWLHLAGVDVHGRSYLGRPVLVTANEPRLQLWNGDLGVVVRSDDGPVVALPAPDGDGVRTLSLARMGDVETVHAMTVHKSQGSQVDHAVVVLPDPVSRVCTRELLYTAVTRARHGATVIASEASLCATIAARTQRASGLGIALGR